MPAAWTLENALCEAIMFMRINPVRDYQAEAGIPNSEGTNG
jgi:hypothetical protein